MEYLKKRGPPKRIKSDAERLEHLKAKEAEHEAKLQALIEERARGALVSKHIENARRTRDKYRKEAAILQWLVSQRA